MKRNIAGFNRPCGLLVLFALFSLLPSLRAQVPVTVGPEPKTQFLDNSGAPLSGGIVCTFSAGTNVPQATFTDSTGSVQNSNPIVLDSGGRANIWWTSAAYKVVLAGGGTCASPSNLQWTVDNFQVGVFLNGNNTWTGTNTFNGVVTFNAAANLTAGGSMNGTFTGNPNFSGSPTFSGTIVANQFQSTVATGTPPLIVASTTEVANLNVAALDGCVTTGTPSAGQVLQASSPTACGWVTASQFPSVVYSTPSASTNANINYTTIFTPAATATFRISFSFQLSVVGSSCTGSTLLSANVQWTDPLAAGSYVGNGNSAIELTNSSANQNGILGPAFQSGLSYSETQVFRVKGGTPIQYQVIYSLGSGCSPGPSYITIPVLEQLTAN